MELVPVPSHRVALDVPATRAALARYVVAAIGVLAAAPLSLAAVRLLIVPGGRTRAGWPDWLPVVPIVLGPMAALAGLVMLGNAVRMWRVLRSSPWSTLPATAGWEVDDTNQAELSQPSIPYVVRARPRVLLDLSHPEGDPLYVVAVATAWKHYQAEALHAALAPGWRKGVVTSPDLRHLSWARAGSGDRTLPPDPTTPR